MRDLKLALFAAVFLAAGCTNGESINLSTSERAVASSDYVDLGDCPPEHRKMLADNAEDRISAIERLTDNTYRWAEFNAIDFGRQVTRDQLNRTSVTLVNPIPLRASNPSATWSDLLLFTPDRQYVERAIAKGRTMMAGVDESDYIRLVIAVDSSGHLAAVGRCAAVSSTPEIAAFISRRSRDSRAASDEVKLVLTEAPPDTNGSSDGGWATMQPDRRQLHPSETPPEIMAALRPVTVQMELGRGWSRDSSVLVCSRIPEIAWGPCARLGATGPTRLDLPAYASESYALELWLVGEDANLASPIGRAATLQTDASVISVSPGPEVATVKDLVARVTSGDDFALVAP